MNYTALAPIYDLVMTHVKYDLWHSLIDTIADKYFNHTPTVFEIGGGTGVLATLLRKSGYPYYGSDLSFAMCKEARKKNIPFICANGLFLPVKDVADLVIFLYDGINYLESLDHYHHLFKEVSRHIKTGGYFLFDITTERNSETYFSDIIDSDDFGYASYTRHSYYDKERKIQNNDFTIYSKHSENNGLFIKENECHAQRIFTVQEISDAIPDSLFSIAGIWDNFSFNRYTPASERIHFLIQKKVSHD